MFRLNIFYFICMKRDWLYVVCLIAFLVEHILFLPTMQLESLIIQPAFITYPIYLYYYYYIPILLPYIPILLLYTYTTTLYTYTTTTITSLTHLRLIIFCFFLLKVNSWVEDEVVLLKCVDLDVF